MQKLIITLVIAIFLVTPKVNAEDNFSILSPNENVTISGCIEAEVTHSSDYDDVKTNDIAMTTAELVCQSKNQSNPKQMLVH